MKVYSKLVIEIETGRILESESFDHEGPAALAFGGRRPKPRVVPVTETVRRPELTPEEEEEIVQGTRSGLAARGLAGSGVAQAAETEAVEKARLGTRPTVTTSQKVLPAPAPRGILGLK